ncbi:hypothetical protein GF336_01925 [Candidatus Woesearchaeota archaeon]|nr:hypothetical protein [Candidatus Woesearchaeota archaeon]
MLSRLSDIIKNSRVGKGLAIAGVSFALNTSLFADKAEDTFKAIYSKQEKEVNESKDAKKHLEFGKKLFEESKNNEILEEVLEEHAIMHLKKHKDGYASIFEIHKDDMKDFSSEKDKYLKLIIDDAEELSKKLKYNDPNKKEIHKFIADNYCLLGDILEENREYSSAAHAFKDAYNKFRSLNDFKKLKELRKKRGENERFAKEFSDLKGEKLGIELLKKGEYSKAAEHLNEDYSSVIEFLTSDSDEKITSKGLTESYMKKTLEKIKDRDKKGLSELIKPYCLVKDLRDEVVVSLSMLDKETDWNYIDNFGEKIKKYFEDNAKTPGFDVEKGIGTARLFDSWASSEERRFVKRDLMLKTLELYTEIGKNLNDKEGNTKAEELALIEASKKVDSLGKELEKYKGVEIGDLEMNLAGDVKIPKGCVLYMSFDKDTVFKKDGKWYVKDLSGKGNHGEIKGKFAGLKVYDSSEKVPAEYDLALVKGHSRKFGDSAMYFAGKKGYVEVKDDDSLDFGKDIDFTLSGYFNLKNSRVNHCAILDNRSNKLPYQGFIISIDRERLAGGIRDFKMETIKTCGKVSLTNNIWSKFRVVYERNKDLILYINSVKCGSKSISHIDNINVEGKMVIGAPSKESTLNYFNGFLDKLTISNLIPKK